MQEKQQAEQEAQQQYLTEKAQVDSIMQNIIQEDTQYQLILLLLFIYFSFVLIFAF